MYEKIFEEVGLSKNEAKIYEALLEEEELSVSEISTKAKIHRRNVYDSLNRLLEKGFVFELLQKKENMFKAVDPKKLMEILKEKEDQLEKVMPKLISIYKAHPREEEVYIYKGIEGWKNYLRDILNVGKSVCAIGGKGSWANERLQGMMEEFKKETEKNNIDFQVLFDYEVKGNIKDILQNIPKCDHRFLPKEYSTSSAIDIYGDRIVIHSKIGLKEFDEDTSFTVIVNQEIADAFRTWFKFMWENANKS